MTDDQQPEETKPSLATRPGSELAPRSRPVTWGEVGDTFESMGKIGFALAIGLSAAGIFCRLADQGKVRVPNLAGMILAKESSVDSKDKREKES
ncbi:MAG TPA: hypothetical protein EYO33_21810 [Phycisphaerales bacterium]|nr:hypothetical protein [Phycisphaerales bacterium]